MKRICLIGNPNCGKTTIFNNLTGTYQKVGNWAGVTTEKKQGVYKKNDKVIITDLPGLYSLTPRSGDERAVIQYLQTEKPDCIINVVDATNIQRNLFLTCALYKLDIPVVIAVNFADELKKNGIDFNSSLLKEMFGVPVVLVSGLKNVNLDQMIDLALTTDAKINKPPEQAYSFIEKNVKNLTTLKPTLAQRITKKVDCVLLNRYLSVPIFVCVIALVYFLSIKVGGILSVYVKEFFETFSNNTRNSLTKLGAKEWLISLLADAVLGGFGTVMSFLPQVLVLFLLLTVIEESGYASRVAFITDKLFSGFGLSGKSFIPMMLCSGCTATGLMATKTIESSAERRMTVFLSPFIPCGAKTAVFGWFSGLLFNGSVFVATSMYFLGMACVVVFGNVLKRLKTFSKDRGLFVMEIPTLRLPVVKNVLWVLWEKVKDFTVKTGTVIFSVSVVLWLLNNFGFSGYTYGNAQTSFLFYLGNLIKYLFVPLGFGNWQSGVAVISSIMAKEAVIESLTFLATDVSSLFYNGYSAYAFMVFILLSPPCIASITTAYKQLNSKKQTAFMLVFQTASAYLVALIINLTGILVQLFDGLLFFILFVIITTLATVFTVKTIHGDNCNCLRCKGKDKCQKKLKRNTTI